MPPRLSYYSAISRDEAIGITVDLHREAETLTRRIAMANYRIELAILVLSVVTSGAIWVVAAGSFPRLLAWFGAAFSTVVTGLTIYQLTLGPKRQVKDAYSLYQATERELAILRGGSAFDCGTFWDHYKDLENRLMALETPPS